MERVIMEYVLPTISANWVSLTLLALVYLLYSLMTSSFTYFRDIGLPFLKPGPLGGPPAGTSLILGKISFHEFNKQNYEYLKKYPVAGYFEGRNPVVMVMEPRLINAVLTKDFTHFSNKINYGRKSIIQIHKMILFLEGEEWKRVRARLTPTFSSAKIRAMDPLIQQCCRQMISFLNQRPPGDTEIELKMLTCRFTLDLIGCTAFGIDCASLKNPEAEFVQKAEAVFTNSRLSNFFFFSFGGLSKSMLKYMPVSMFNSKSLHYLCDVISSVMKDRELDPTKRRKDFLQYLMDSGQNEDTSSEKKVMDDVMIKSQALGFFVAGSETSSTTLSFACAVMAHTPDLQDKLRNDIQAAVEKAPDLCPYDLVNEIPLLEKVLCETLRLYSPLPRLERACSKEYQFPDSDVRINVGDSLVVPIPQIMRDPQYFPDPEAFDPERFSPEEIKRRPNEVFMPFGSGPRICIGMRFAMISMKLFLFHFLTNFKLTPSDKTRMPFAFDKRSVMLKADHGLWVNIEPLKDN